MKIHFHKKRDLIKYFTCMTQLGGKKNLDRNLRELAYRILSEGEAVGVRLLGLRRLLDAGYSVRLSRDVLLIQNEYSSFESLENVGELEPGIYEDLQGYIVPATVGTFNQLNGGQV